MNLIKSAFALLLSVPSVASADTDKNILFGTTDIDVGAVTLTKPSWNISANKMTPTDSSWDIDDSNKLALTESGLCERCRCNWNNRRNGCFDQRVSGCTDLEDVSCLFHINPTNSTSVSPAQKADE